jgi:uncharacterized protein (TIGR02444 family)
MPADSPQCNEWPDETQLWQWSLALYPLIKPQCLQWQDQYQANVNLLLLLLYLQRQQQQLTASQLQQLCDALLPQQQFTRQLRQLRRQLPPYLTETAASPLKHSLLQAELCSERLEQRLLVQALPQLSHHNLTTATATKLLLPLYLQQLQIPLSSALQQQMLDLDQSAGQVGWPSR